MRDSLLEATERLRATMAAYEGQWNTRRGIDRQARPQIERKGATLYIVRRETVEGRY